MSFPPYDRFPVLQAGPYVLRQVQPEELAGLLEILFYDGQPATSTAAAQEILDKINADYANGEGINWGIEDPATGALLGTLGFYRGFAGGQGEAGCILKAEARGRGCMSAAMRAICAFGFNVLKLNCINAFTRPDNGPARALLTRLHFEHAAESSAGGKYLAYRLLPGRQS